jgi:hypothetical protein
MGTGMEGGKTYTTRSRPQSPAVAGVACAWREGEGGREGRRWRLTGSCLRRNDKGGGGQEGNDKGEAVSYLFISIVSKC